MHRPDAQEGVPKGPGEATSGLAVTVGGANNHKNSPLSEALDRGHLISHREPIDSETT